jgi:hypothetical protein
MPVPRHSGAPARRAVGRTKMNVEVSTVYPYKGPHVKLGSSCGRREGGHTIMIPNGSPLPPTNQQLHCAICAAFVHMTLSVPEEGVDVGVGAYPAEVMAAVERRR